MTVNPSMGDSAPRMNVSSADPRREAVTASELLLDLPLPVVADIWVQAMALPEVPLAERLLGLSVQAQQLAVELYLDEAYYAVVEEVIGRWPEVATAVFCRETGAPGSDRADQRRLEQFFLKRRAGCALLNYLQLLQIDCQEFWREVADLARLVGGSDAVRRR